MAQVPYDPTPNVAPLPDVPKNDYINVPTATPAAFGGIAAQGMKELGAGFTQASLTFGEVAADAQVNAYMPQVRDLQDSYGKLSTQEKLEQYSNHIEKLGALRDNLRQQLPNIASQQKFDSDSRRMQMAAEGTITNQNLQAHHQYALDTNKNSIQQNMDMATAAPESDEAASMATQGIIGAQVKLASLTYRAGSPEQIEATKNIALNATRDVSFGRIAALIDTNPEKAKSIMDSDQPIAEGSSVTLKQVLQGDPRFAPTYARAEAKSSGERALRAVGVYSALTEIKNGDIIKNSPTRTITATELPSSENANRLVGTSTSDSKLTAKTTAFINGLNDVLTPVYPDPKERNAAIVLANRLSYGENAERTNIIHANGKSLPDNGPFPDKNNWDDPNAPSHASGYYGFQPKTWDDPDAPSAAKEANVDPNDFSFRNQTLGAVAWAKRIYAQKTDGRNLLTDMANGEVTEAKLNDTLGKTWTSLNTQGKTIIASPTPDNYTSGPNFAAPGAPGPVSAEQAQQLSDIHWTNTRNAIIEDYNLKKISYDDMMEFTKAANLRQGMDNDNLKTNMGAWRLTNEKIAMDGYLLASEGKYVKKAFLDANPQLGMALAEHLDQIQMKAKDQAAFGGSIQTDPALGPMLISIQKGDYQNASALIKDAVQLKPDSLPIAMKYYDQLHKETSQQDKTADATSAVMVEHLAYNGIRTPSMATAAQDDKATRLMSAAEDWLSNTLKNDPKLTKAQLINGGYDSRLYKEGLQPLLKTIQDEEIAKNNQEKAATGGASMYIKNGKPVTKPAPGLQPAVYNNLVTKYYNDDSKNTGDIGFGINHLIDNPSPARMRTFDDAFGESGITAKSVIKAFRGNGDSEISVNETPAERKVRTEAAIRKSLIPSIGGNNTMDYTVNSGEK